MEPFRHNSFALQGLGLSWGSLHWDQPRFPTLNERALLIARALPTWAIASGITAGWVWTGMGVPEPWDVLRPPRPALSPIARTQWSARERNSRHHLLRQIGDLNLLTPESTAREVLLSPEPVGVRASQLWVLEDLCTQPLNTLVTGRRSSLRARNDADRALIALANLRERYPDITRYTS